jgi:preprotein translocase SecE subunit
VADKPAPKKRLVKNPETFREKALKAGTEADKPTRMSGVKTAGGKAVSPVGTAARKVSAFKPVGTPLRLVGRILFPKYFRQSWGELRQVQWPGRRESIRLTYAVLLFAVIFGGLVAIVDYGLDKVFRNILLK